MILITGCTGYIGSRLTQALLKAGHSVRGLVLPQERARAARLIEAGMEAWPGDLLIPETLRGIAADVTTLYHLAGLHSAIPDRMEQLYVEGTRALIQACVGAPLRTCIIASNGAVYGDGGDEWLTEERPPAPTHPFGWITLRQEQLLLEAYRATRWPTIILRIAEVYGPGEYDLLKRARSETVRLLGDGMNWTAHIHIDDLLRVLLLAPDRLCPGSIYNVADNFPVRQRDLYADLADRLGIARLEWLPLADVPERIRLSLHGLRALSLRLANGALISALQLALRYPTYQEGIASSAYFLRSEGEP